MLAWEVECYSAIEWVLKETTHHMMGRGASPRFPGRRQ